MSFSAYVYYQKLLRTEGFGKHRTKSPSPLRNQGILRNSRFKGIQRNWKSMEFKEFKRIGNLWNSRNLVYFR